MTPAQKQWLEEHPNYQSVGQPRAGVRFINCGTLYADGTFEKLEAMKPVKLQPGCFCVGIKVHGNT